MGCLGQTIKEARVKKGLTQEDLARMLERSKSAVSNWERGDNSPEAELLGKLCGILDLSPNELMGWEESETNGFRAFGIDAETGEIIPQLNDSQIADILKDVMDLPKEALGELRYSIEFLKYKYRKD